MTKKTTRLHFIDAIRAWAILMMLQGHFIDGLLDTAFRSDANQGYVIWKYFRGMTAPVFFTVSGFIFTYLLVRVPQTGFDNPRVKKGIKRGLELLFIGYLLRTNFGGLLHGQIYNAFYLVDVLHCIGLSLLGIIGMYLLTYSRKKVWFSLLLVATTLLLFLFEPVYKQWSYMALPDALANYFTKKNGSVFTIIPWFGYTTFGAFAAMLFTRFKSHKNLYPVAISISVILGTLLLYSSEIFMGLSRLTGIELFKAVYSNNYLFIRLGDVFIAFAVFMVLRNWLTNSTLLKIGQSTLSIYVIHFIILYGSFTGLGLYRFFNHSLTPTATILGAITFMIICSFTALQYEKHKAVIKEHFGVYIRAFIFKPVRQLFKRAKHFVSRLFGLVKN